MTNLSIERQVELLGFLREHADEHYLARNDATVKALFNQLIDDALKTLQPPPMHFQWTGPRLFHVDGIEMRAKGLGLSLAWMRFAAAQTGVGVPHLGYAFGGKSQPGKCATQALQRAADEVEPVHRRLASAIRGIGTSRGHLVLPGRRPNVICSSPFLVDLARRAEQLGFAT
jgi:hypothetical protein